MSVFLTDLVILRASPCRVNLCLPPFVLDYPSLYLVDDPSYAFKPQIIVKLPTGSILVFLPGYDDIITLKERLAADKEFGNIKRFVE